MREEVSQTHMISEDAEALTRVRRLSRALASHIDFFANSPHSEPGDDDLRALSELAWMVENTARDLDCKLNELDEGGRNA